MPPSLRWLSLAGCVVYLLAAIAMGLAQQAGPASALLVLPGGIPATLHLPGPERGRDAFARVPPREERPPGVVLMHGFASDRLGVSTLARRLAGAGYAVLSFDASGHGQSRKPFQRSFARPDAFFDEIATAVDALRADPRVDGTRLAVMGHSMGAGATLDFATRDQGLDAVVAIAGGFAIHGPFRPPNVLFLYAEGDPPRIPQRAHALADELVGERVELGRSYGDPSLRTAVQVVEVPGTDHLTVVWSERSALEIARWLDRAFGRPPTPGVPSDPRLAAAAVSFLALLLVLPGVGEVVGRLASRRPPRQGSGAARGLLALTAALVLVMPLLAVDVPLAFLPVEVGDVVVSQLALAGVGLVAWLRLRGELEPTLLHGTWTRSLFAAAVGFAAFATLLLPLSAVVHRLSLTPERVVVFGLAALALLPFSFAFQWLLRGGSAVRAAGLSALGRLLVLALLVAGVQAGLLGSVVILMLPALALMFVLIELLLASLYAVSRDVAAIALLDAAALAFVIAAVMPVRL